MILKLPTYLLLFFFLLSTHSSFTQITLTAKNTPKAEHEYTFSPINFDFSDTIAVGSNITWDFSHINDTLSNWTNFYTKDTAFDPFPGSIPHSSFFISNTNGIRTNGGIFEIIGDNYIQTFRRLYVADIIRVPVTIRQIPFDFGDSFSQTVSYQFVSQEKRTTTVSGHGRLILSDTLYDSTLLVHTKIRLGYTVGTSPSADRDTAYINNYEWFTKESNVPILTIVYDTLKSLDPGNFLFLSIKNKAFRSKGQPICRDSISLEVCDSYLLPSGEQIISDTIISDTTNLGPDSCIRIQTINLKIQDTSEYITVSNCGIYISPSGKAINMSGIIKDTIYRGADSCRLVYTVDLTILDTAESITVSSCKQYISPTGKIFSSSGTYKDTIYQGADSCRLVYTINLTMLDTAESITFSSCKQYTSPSGKIFNSSGTFKDTLYQTPDSCRIIYDIDLTITNVQASIIRENFTLISDSSSNLSTLYEWVDCDSNYQILERGLGLYHFEVPKNGNYAAILSSNNCSDTSDCIRVTNVSLKESNSNDKNFSVYPIPTKGTLHIEIPKVLENNLPFVLYELNGKEIQKGFITKKHSILDLNHLSPGIYLIQIGREMQKIVLQP